jgi:hypothetical protein
VEPKLALVYNSQAGNGLLGVGWNLEGLSAITRCARTVAQDGVRGSVNYDSNDRFCLDGQRLVMVSGSSYGADGAQYRTERESFSKIISFGQAGSGPAWFQVWTKGGQILEYGRTGDSRMEARPGQPTVRAWAVNKVSDARGNDLAVTYAKDGANGSHSASRIDYAFSAGSSASVRFTYQSRPDVPHANVAGSSVNIPVRLSGIRTYAGEAPVSDYRLAYQMTAATSRSRLASLTECNGDGSSCLAPLTLAWLDPPAAVENVGWGNGHGVGPPGWRLVDLFGNGHKVYHTRIDTTHFATRLNPDGTLQNWTWSGGHGEGDAGWDFADLFGEGRQLYYTHLYGGCHYATRLNEDGTHQNYGWCGGHGVGSAGWRIADLFGDGRQVYYTRTHTDHYATRLNPDGTVQNWTWAGGHGEGDAGWSLGDLFGEGRQLYFTHLYSGCHYATRLNPDGTHQNYGWCGGHGVGSAGWRLVDLFGDGRQLYHTRTHTDHHATRLNPDGTVQNWTWSGGHGDGSAGWDFADLFGEGRQLYYTHSYDTCHYATRLNANGTFQNYGWCGGHGVGNGGWALGDLLGTGRPVYFTRQDTTHYITRFINGPADLASGISNGTDPVATVSYKPLTESSVYAKDAGAVYPLQNLKSPLYVVSSATQPNGIGGSRASSFSYGGLNASADGRGSLGFRWRESTDQPSGLKVRTEYRQDWPYLGLPSMMRRTQASGAVLSQTLNTYGSTHPAAGVYFPFVSQSVESGNDLNSVALPAVTTTASYDAFGNPTSIAVSTSDGHGKSTTNVFANDSVNWLLGRLLRSTVQSTSP